MHSYHAILAILAATSVTALPLNINLGAFSPALVVGDGEISFGGEKDVSSLMTALSGASQSASTGGGAKAEAVAAPATAEKGPSDISPAVITPIDATPSAEAAQQVNAEAVVLPQGMGKAREVIEPRVADNLVAKRSVEEDTVAIEDAEDAAEANEKRDLAGFNAALAFATGALKNGPEVQLGTGEGGSGVGIISRPAGAAAAGGKKAEKREALPTVTMIKLRTIGDKSALPKARRSENIVNPIIAREVEEDAVNLNLAADGQEYEVTITEVKP